MRDNVAKYEHNPGKGIDRDGVRYTQDNGKLDKYGNIGFLKTIVLPSDWKVYQIDDVEDHVELCWQNDKKN